MSIEFDIRRHTDKIEELRAEQERLNNQLPKLRQDEQDEITRVQRTYTMKTNQLQSRLKGIKKEIEGHERQLDSLETKLEKEDKSEEEEKKSPYRRY